MSVQTVPDRHVHTQWSWDATHGDMLATCRRAAELGLPAIALTEHADFTPFAHARGDDNAGSVRVIADPDSNGSLDIAVKQMVPKGGCNCGLTGFDLTFLRGDPAMSRALTEVANIHGGIVEHGLSGAIGN